MMRVVRPVCVLAVLAVVAGLHGQEKKADPETKLPAGVRLRLGTDRFREPSYISATAMSPNGREIAVCSGSTSIRFVDEETGRELRAVTIKEYLRTNQLFYTPDGKQLVSAGYNGVHVWDAADGKEVRTLAPVDKDRRDGQIYLSADGKAVSVSTMYENAMVKVLRLADGEALGTIKPVHNSTLYSALSPNGEMVATWGQHYARGNPTPADAAMPRTVHLWDVKTAKQTAALEADSATVTAVKFSPDGKQVATVGFGIIQLWETATGKTIRRFAGRGSSTAANVAFSPDGKTLSVSGGLGSVQSWDVTTGKRVGQCEGPTNAVVNLHYRPDGQLLAWGVNTNTLALWEAPSGKQITPPGGHYAPVTTMQFTPDNKHLLSCGQDGRMIRWEADTGKELEPAEPRPETVAKRRMFGYPRSTIAPAVFSPDGKYFVGTSSDGGGTGVWDAAANQELFALAGGQGYVDRTGVIAFSPDSKKLVAINRYNGREVPMPIPVWDVDTSLPLPPLKGQKGDFTSAAFSTDGAILVTCSYAYAPQGGQIAEAWAWDIATGKTLSKLQLPNMQLTNVAFLDHRLYVAHTGAGQGQKIYDALTGQEARALEGTGIPQALCMTLSPDRRLIGMGIVGNDQYGPNGQIIRMERRVVVWEAASGAIRHDFKITGPNVMALAFSRDGKTLAVALSDTTILLFDLLTASGPQKAIDLPDLWKSLDDPSGRPAFAAMEKLMASPAEAVAFLKTNLKPATGAKPDPAKLAKLIGDLDSPRYVVRETAMKELEKIGAQARDAVREALEKKTLSPEMRERLEKLTDKTNKPDTGTEFVRPLRAIEVLERINSADARAHLEALAAGGDAPPTRAAKDAVQRLGVR